MRGEKAGYLNVYILSWFCLKYIYIYIYIYIEREREREVYVGSNLNGAS